MKPLLITMQGFGSYIDRTVIDFTALGENPIFLITGATGGGKTTILDAMCFALFCKATGRKRSWAEMRSTAADERTPTVVSFVFRLGTECYRFYRSQQVYQMRGSGRKAIREEHACYRLCAGAPCDETAQWELLETGSESKVRDYAQKLLGLTCEQFAQVIVLPQGNFLQLLRASSKEKTAILQTLFSTQIWERITLKMRRYATKLEQKAGQVVATKTTLFARENVQNAQELLQKEQREIEKLQCAEATLKQLQQDLQLYSAKLDAAKLLSQKLEYQHQLREQQTQLETQKSVMAQTKQRLETAQEAERLYPYWFACHTAAQQVTQKTAQQKLAQQELARAQAGYDALQKQQADIAQKKEKLLQLEQSLPTLERSARARKRQTELLTRKEQTTAELNRIQKIEQEMTLQLAQLDERVQTGEQYLQNLLQTQQRLPQEEERMRTLREYEKQLQTAHQQTLACTEAKQIFAAAQSAKLQAEQLLEQAKQETASLQEQETAYRLAQMLEHDLPCPVCGSSHHPQPATTTANMDHQQIHALIKRQTELQTAYEQQLQAFSRAQTMLEERQKQAADSNALCARIPVSTTEIPSLIEKQGELLTKMQKLLETREKSEQKLQKLTDRQKQLVNACEQLKQDKNTVLQKTASIEAALKEIQESIQLPANSTDPAAAWQHAQRDIELLRTETMQWEQQWLTTSAELAAKRANLQSTKAAQAEAATAQQQAQQSFLEKQAQSTLPVGLDSDLQAMRVSPEVLQAIEAQLNTYAVQTQTVAGQLEQLSQELNGVTPPATEQLENQCAALQKQREETSVAVGGQKQRLQELQKSLEELQTLEQSGKAAQMQYEQATRLAELLNGGNAKKIALEPFVLGIMLDDILAYANEFFARLSRGRYSLRRLEGSLGGNAKSGLDLEVLDGFTGAARSIETLSGGEQFLASLALAFGLSDVVQSYSGSVQLDSIFIDEGFGTLDRETLDTAMKALAQIQKMGRTVGIISHVNELKNCIAAQIRVQPAKKGGSTVTVIADT